MPQESDAIQQQQQCAEEDHKQYRYFLPSGTLYVAEWLVERVLLEWSGAKNILHLVYPRRGE